VIVAGVAALAPGGAGRARRAAGAGRRGRSGALAAGAVYCSRSSNWRAKLIAAARDWGFWIRTSMLSGGWRPPVNS
jgi:hypothetical protein